MRLSGLCVYYSGSNLSGPGINTGDNLNIVVNKLTQFIGSGGFNAENALDLTSGLLTWGGPLTQTTVITGTTDAETITFTGDVAGVFFEVINADVAGTALYAQGNIAIEASGTQIGVNVSATTTAINASSSGVGVVVNSTGDALRTSSGNGYGATITNLNTSFPSLLVDRFSNPGALTATMLLIRNRTNAVVALNNAIAIDIQPMLPGSQQSNATSIVARWVGSLGSPTSQTEIWGFNANVAQQTYTMMHANNGKMGIGVTAPTAALHLRAGTTGVSTAPLKFTSGPLLTTAEVGAVEFLTDKAYLTITTGAARKEFTLNDATLTNLTLPIATTNGRLVNSVVTYNSGSARLIINAATRGTTFQSTDNPLSPTTVTIYDFNSISNTVVQANYSLSFPNTATLILLVPTVRVGDTSAGTAKIDIIGNVAGTAGRAPLKFHPGANMSVPEDGAFEYDGTNLYFTISSTRSAVVLGATPGQTIYTGDGTIGGTRAINVNNFSVTWNNTGLFRIVNGTTTGGTYDFNTAVNLQSYDATNSSNFVVDPVTGLTFEYSLLSGPTILSSLTVDSLGTKLTGVLEFADNAAALLGGLTAGYIYRTGDALKIVH